MSQVRQEDIVSVCVSEGSAHICGGEGRIEKKDNVSFARSRGRSSGDTSIKKKRW